MTSRIDIKHGVVSGAWSGKDCLPFGLISCPGWVKPIQRLSNKLASINRHYCRHGCMYKLVNIRPSSEGLVFDASVKIIGRPTHESRMAFSFAMRLARASCARMCQVCGRPSRHVLGLSVCCDHAPQQVRIETYFDKRKIRRSGILLAARFGANITHGVKCKTPGGNLLGVYCIDGTLMARILDARPGSRSQLIASARGVINQISADEYFIECSTKDWISDRI